MRRLTALAAVALLTGCGGGSHKGISIRVDQKPFRISVLVDGKTLVAESKDARLRYQVAPNGDQHHLTNVISSREVEPAGLGGPFTAYLVRTDEPGRTATVSVGRTEHGVVIAMRLHPEKGVQQVYDAFDSSGDDHFLGGGERSGAVDLRGQILPVKVSNACSYAPVPYFASSAGWALGLATQTVSALAFPGSSGGGGCRFGAEPQCTFPALRDRVEVCVRGAALDEELYAGSFPEALEAFAGTPPAPPRSELALIKWRDVYDDDAQVFEDVSKLRAAKIPLGWILVDNPWEGCVGDLTFDPHRFRDPRAMIARVHSLGLRFMLWVSPKTQCGNGYPKRELLGPADQLVLDLRKHAVVRQFERRLAALASMGVDGFKADRGDEVDLEAVSERLQNDYPLLYARAVMSALPTGAAAIFRAATAGSQDVIPGLWAGDQEGTWAGLQQAIRAGETAAMSGFPSWGSDVGGYHSQTLTGDLFARWAQLGAVSPVMEVGGQGPNATPWTMGPDAISALREAAVLHYELFPYLYGLLVRGEPVLRPLGYGFPDDPGSWRADLELLVGPDLLAAPVTGGGTTPSVYLPPGDWIDLHTGATAKGPASFTRATPLDVLPLYLRAGAVIPFDLRTAPPASWWGTDELTHPGRAGFLVSDGAVLDLLAQPHDVQLFVPAAARPAGVTLAGKSVPWTWSPGPLPGAVIRTHGPSVTGRIVLHAA